VFLRIGVNVLLQKQNRSSDLVLAQPEDTGLVILAAAKLGTTRLIDNLCCSRQTAF
jgi:pantothenate synthetase